MVIIGRRWSKSTCGANKVNSTLRNSVKMNSHMSDADGGQVCKLKDENRGLLPESNMMHQKYKAEPHQVRMPKQPINCSKHTGENWGICVHHIHSTQVEMRKARTYVQHCAVSFSTYMLKTPSVRMYVCNGDSWCWWRVAPPPVVKDSAKLSTSLRMVERIFCLIFAFRIDQ